MIKLKGEYSNIQLFIQSFYIPYYHFTTISKDKKNPISVNLTRKQILWNKTPCYPSLRNCVCLWRTGWPSGILSTTHGFIITRRQVGWRKHTWNNMHKKNILFRSQHVGQAGGAGPHDAGHPGGGGDQEPRVSSQCDQTSVRCGQGPASSEGEVAIQTVQYIPASLQSASRGIFEVI